MENTLTEKEELNTNCHFCGNYDAHLYKSSNRYLCVDCEVKLLIILQEYLELRSKGNE